MRHLVIVLGDQLDDNSAVFDGFDPQEDRIWMAEASGEATHVWSHKARIAVFLSAMRHFRDRLLRKGFTVVYRRIGEHSGSQLSQLLREDIERLQPVKLIMVQAGEFRVQQAIETTAKASGVPLGSRPDRRFMLDTEEFSRWARGKRELRAENLYRYLRKKTGILMEAGQPLGGRWNCDWPSFALMFPVADRPSRKGHDHSPQNSVKEGVQYDETAHDQNGNQGDAGISVDTVFAKHCVCLGLDGKF